MASRLTKENGNIYLMKIYYHHFTHSEYTHSVISLSCVRSIHLAVAGGNDFVSCLSVSFDLAQWGASRKEAAQFRFYFYHVHVLPPCTIS